MGRGNIQSPVFAEESHPFCLKEMSAYRIYGYGIGPHDQPLVGPNISSVEEIGSSSIKLRGKGAEDIQAGLPLHDGISPYLAQGRATFVMVGRRVWDKLDVILKARPDPSPVMRPQGSHIDQRSRIEEDRITQNSPVIDVDILPCYSHIQEPALNSGFQFFGGRQLLP